MARKKLQEINFDSVKERKRKSIVRKKIMPAVRCVCGYEILLLPDLKAMDRAIKKHVADHKQVDYGLAFDSLEEFLVEQVLLVASKLDQPNVN